MEYRRNSKPMTAEERIEASKQSASVRQALMETMLVPYPQFRDGIKFIRKFHVPVEGGNPSAGRIGGLLGESRVGKTVICNFSCQRIHLPTTMKASPTRSFTYRHLMK